MSTLFIRMSDLASGPNRRGLLPVRANTIWRWARLGLFPKPVKLSPQVSAWRLSEIQTWASTKGVEINLPGSTS